MLHAVDAGLWGKHMWPLFEKYIQAIRPKIENRVDEQYVDTQQ